jgi:predicted DNA-binding protein
MKATAKLLRDAVLEEERKTVSIRVPSDLHKRFAAVSAALAKHGKQAPSQTDLLLAAYAEGVDDLEAVLERLKEEHAQKHTPPTPRAAPSSVQQ